MLDTRTHTIVGRSAFVGCASRVSTLDVFTASSVTGPPWRQSYAAATTTKPVIGMFDHADLATRRLKEPSP